MTICYNMIFPDYARRLIDLDADIVIDNANRISDGCQRGAWSWNLDAPRWPPGRCDAPAAGRGRGGASSGGCGHGPAGSPVGPRNEFGAFLPD